MVIILDPYIMKLILIMMLMATLTIVNSFKIHHRKILNNVRRLELMNPYQQYKMCKHTSLRSSVDNLDSIVDNIKSVGDEIRILKQDKVNNKDLITNKVNQLNELKSKYEDESGKPYDVSTSKPKVQKSTEKSTTTVASTSSSSSNSNTNTVESVITPRNQDYSTW